MSISGLLNISWNAISSNQIAINMTGANIANVNTPGYTRQSANFNATGSIDVSAGRIDFGVRVDSIERLYNRYLETQLVDQAQKMGFDETRQQILGRVEGVFNETGGSGLSDSLNQFWNSWDTLSSNPDSQVARYSVVSAASNLTSLFRENSDVLTGVQQDIKDSMTSTVADINSLITEISKLNQQILATNLEDGSANNLLDRRMELVKGLAENINISYNEKDNGTLDVFISGGEILIGSGSYAQLSASNGDVTIAGETTSLNSIITGGRLGAMIAMDGTTVDDYSARLDRLADGIVKAVNDLHTLGSHIDDPVAAEGYVNKFAGDVESGGDFRGISNMTYAMRVTTGGLFGGATTAYEISTDGGDNWVAGPVTVAGNGVINLGDGVSLTFDATEPLVTGDAFYVNAYPPLFDKDYGSVFFDDSQAGARNMRVSDAILNDPQNIVASVPGNDAFIDDPIGPIAAEGPLNAYAGTVLSSGTFTGDVNMAYALEITLDGTLLAGDATYRISTNGGPWVNGPSPVASSGIISLGDDGVLITFDDDLVAGDIFYVNAYPPADYSIARMIGAVKDKLFMDGGASTFNDFYASLVGRVGSKVNEIGNSIERNTAVTNQLMERRDEASGVSLDEEIINLMKYQFGYNVAGKLAKTANDILDVLMALGR